MMYFLIKVSSNCHCNLSVHAVIATVGKTFFEKGHQLRDLHIVQQPVFQAVTANRHNYFATFALKVLPVNRFCSRPDILKIQLAIRNVEPW